MFKWLGKNDYINNKSIPRTHTLMSGGVINIPDEVHMDFLHEYSKEIGKNDTLTFSELRSSPVSKMYFDVDLLDEKKLGEDFTIILSSTIQRVIKTYYPTTMHLFQCVVCTTTPKPISKDGIDLIKNGFHIIFPNLNINIEQAYQLRYNVVYELERVMGSRQIPSNPWADAIDKAPYKGGLKMCGSYKMVKCLSCKDSKKEQKEGEKIIRKKIADMRRKIFPKDAGFNYQDLGTLESLELKDSMIFELYGEYMDITSGRKCHLCTNGKCIEKRTYMPSLVLDTDGTKNEELVTLLLSDMYETMKYTSIRCSKDDLVTPSFKKPSGVPSCPDETNSANMRNLDRVKLDKMSQSAMMEVLSEGVFKDDEDGVYTWKGPQTFDTDKVKSVEQFIQGLKSGPYSNLQVKTIFEHNIAKKETNGRESNGAKSISSIISSNKGQKSSNTSFSIEKSFLVRVHGEGSTYCANKGGEHESNSIYFRFTSQFCYQKCFSRKEDVRTGGNTTCGTYRSPGVRLTSELSKLLFPDEDIPITPTSSMAFSKNMAPPKRKNDAAKDDVVYPKRKKSDSMWGGMILK